MTGRHRTSFLAFVAAEMLAVATAACSTEPGTLPAYARWSKIELTFHGPLMHGLGNPNPFAVAFDVMFTAPDGRAFLVPGFYDGDGRGGMDGDVWKVRFSADQNGTWSWYTQSPEPKLNGLGGKILVVDPPVDAPDLYRLGRLEYVGERYLKFREGGYWIKAGADEPENWLGDAFGRDNWEAKKRQIDYLASVGVNSVYVMTHNLGGDGNDVWPWVGATAEEAKRGADRFDIVRLAKWRDFFEYIEQKGLVIHLVLEDDSAWTGYDHARYYREIIARFGDLPAVYFNFCEEYNESYTLPEALAYLDLLGSLDPYGHPRAIHNVNTPWPEYVDAQSVQMSSIQTLPLKPVTLNRLAEFWVAAPLTRSRHPLVVSFDEARPPGSRRSWWAVFLGGGIWESILPVRGGYSEYGPQWRQLALARQFMESIPAHRMFPANHLVVKGEAFCLARPGEFYALYLPDGGEIELNLPAGNRYRLEWFDPRAVAVPPWTEAVEIGGGLRRLAAPGPGDWAARIEKITGEAAAPPLALDAVTFASGGEPVTVHLPLAPPEAVAGAEYAVLTAPRYGRLSGNPPEVTYTPRPGFSGRDRFTWRARTPTGESNTAEVTVFCNPSGTNRPPRAYDQTVRVRRGGIVRFTLRYADRDGPGPYGVAIAKPPEHGAVETLDNEARYTPQQGFTGADSFEWRISDGVSRSGPARVRIRVY